MRWRARTVVHQHGALRPGRPQLKRDPLGAHRLSMVQPSTPLKSVYVTTAAASTVGVIYGLLGIPPSPLPFLFITLAALISVVSWVQRDAHLHHLAPIQDFGLFIYLLWPVLVPWYVVRTRGTRAWTLALLLLTMVLTPVATTLAAALCHDVARALLRHRGAGA